MFLRKSILLIMTVIIVSCGGDGGGGDSSNKEIPVIPVGREDVIINEETLSNVNKDIEVNIGEYKTVSVLKQPSYGNIIGTFPNIVYDVNEGYFGEDRIEFSVVDNDDKSFKVIIIINIERNNTQPVANDQIVFIEKGQGKFFNFDVEDVDGDALDYVIVSYPESGTLYNMNDGTFGLDAPNDEGIVTIQYKVNDGLLDSRIATITVNVTRINKEPVINNNIPDLVVAEDGFVDFIVNVTDGDQDPLNYNLSATQGVLSFVSKNSNDYLIRYTPNENYNGEDTLIISFDDGIGGIAYKEVNVTILSINDKPTIEEYAVTIDENNYGILLDVNIQDVDNEDDELIVDSPTPPQLGDILVVGSSVSYIPKIDTFGVDSFSLRVYDGDQYSQTVNIVVTIEEDIPVEDLTPENINIVVDQGSNVDFILKALNSTNPNLEYEIVTGPSFGVVTGVSPNLNYEPNESFYGYDSLSYKIKYNEVESDIIGFVYIDVNRTDFSKTWSLGRLGDIKDDAVLENAVYNVIESSEGLYINEDDEITYSLYTNNMSCPSFEYPISFIDISGEKDIPIAIEEDLTRNWTCFDDFYLLKEIEGESVLDRTVINYFNNNIFNNKLEDQTRMDYIKNDLSLCSDSDIYNLIASKDELGVSEENCYLELAEYLVINETNIFSTTKAIRPNSSEFTNSTYSLLNSVFKEIQIKDDEDFLVYEDNKDYFIKELIEKRKVFDSEKTALATILDVIYSNKEGDSGGAGDPDGTGEPLPSSYACDNLITIESVWNYELFDDFNSLTQEKEDCLIEIYQSLESQKLFNKTTYVEPISNDTLNNEVKIILRDYLDSFKSYDNNSEGEVCSEISSYLYNKMYVNVVPEGIDLFSYIVDNIAECNPNENTEIPEGVTLEFFTDVVNEEMTLCHDKIYQDIIGIDDIVEESGFSLTELNENSNGERDILMNYYFSMLTQFDNDVCLEENFVKDNNFINNKVYTSNGISLMTFDTILSGERLYLGVKQSVGNENTISNLQLIISNSLNKVNRFNKIDGDSVIASSGTLGYLERDGKHYIQIPGESLGGNLIYNEIIQDGNLLLLSGKFIDNLGVMEEQSMNSYRENYGAVVVDVLNTRIYITADEFLSDTVDNYSYLIIIE